MAKSEFMEIIDCDLLCIGGGAAGATASVTAAQDGFKVVVVDKSFISYGNTRIAGGIVASRNNYYDDAEKFYDDIRAGGAYLNDPKLVWTLSESLPEAINEIEEWGHRFIRVNSNANHLHFIKVGGHSVARTLLSPNKGRSLSHILKFALLNCDAQLLEETSVLSLITRDKMVLGAICLRLRDGCIIAIRAAKTIIASGGAGMLYYPYTDNMNGAVGDGFALALEAGAELIDMELFQYLPFALAYPLDMIGIAIGDPSNAGPYGLLRDKDGEILDDKIYISTRNEASKMISKAIQNGKGSKNGGVFLDLKQNRQHPDGDAAFRVSQEMGMYEILLKAYGKAAAEWQEMFEVRPTVHFTLGGIKINKHGQSGVDNLYAIGEAAGGIHGADRLGSVALAECLVFGMRAARHACGNLYERISKSDFYTVVNEDINSFNSIKRTSGNKISPFHLKTRLVKVMNEYVSIFRNKSGLEKALYDIRELKYLSKTAGLIYTDSQLSLLHSIELGFMLDTAEAVISSALKRKDSVGMHNRTDYPNKAENIKTIAIKKTKRDGMQAWVSEREGENHAG